MGAARGGELASNSATHMAFVRSACYTRDEIGLQAFKPKLRLMFRSSFLAFDSISSRHSTLIAISLSLGGAAREARNSLSSLSKFLFNLLAHASGKKGPFCEEQNFLQD